MKPIRSLLAIGVIAAGAYVSYDNIDRVMSWWRPAPVTSVRVEVPVPVVAIQAPEVEVKAEPKVETAAPKAVVAPQPPAPTKAPVAQATPVTQTVPPAPVDPVVPPTQVPAPVKAVEAPPHPLRLWLRPKGVQAAAELPAEPVKKAIATAPTETAAVTVEPKPAPKTVPPVPTVVAAVPAKEPVKEPVLKPAVDALAAPAKETGKPVSQVAAVVAVSDALPLTPLPAATVPATAQPKDSAQKTKPAAEKVKDIQLTIKDIKFSGVTVFSVKELSKVVSEYVGKELTVQEAFAIPAKVTQHYKNHNHMAIATLVGAITPDGVLTVGVVEMQMSQTQAEKELATLAPPTAAPVPASTSSPAPLPMMVPASPSASSTPLPSKHDADSETDYILKNYAKKSRQFEIVADNFGHESTGGNRMGASFAFDEDRFMVTGFKSQGSDYLRMAVRWATGIEGLKLGASLSRLNYEVVSHLETAIYRSGDAAKKSVELIYQLVNEPGHISSLGLHYASKSIHSIGLNLADSTSMTSSVPSLEWKGMLREMMPGGAVFTYGTSYAHGQVDTTGSSTMGGLDVPEGVFSKLRFDGTLMQPLGGLGSVYGRVSLQTADKNLDPSERLYLGGPLGVRAYGIGDGVGSQGGLFSLEMRQRLAAGTTLTEFFDLGSVRQVNDSHPSTVLKGYGLSLTQDMGDGVTLKGTWARSMGKQPDPALPQNGDGQYDRNRFWLSMESRF